MEHCKSNLLIPVVCLFYRLYWRLNSGPCNRMQVFTGMRCDLTGGWLIWRSCI